jgi:hypothetical protein
LLLSEQVLSRSLSARLPGTGLSGAGLPDAGGHRRAGASGARRDVRSGISRKPVAV